MKQEELVEKLEKVGIKGEWINPDEYGFSRTFQFELDRQVIQIEWYCNYSTLIIGNAHFWFDRISTYSGYPHMGEWIEFIFRNEHPVHLRVSHADKLADYEAIGTIEEFKALKEKAEPKKPILNNPTINEFYVKEAKLCPACHSYINNWSGDYCRDCGQKLDWSE